jgi:hypothetical protein
MPPATAGWQQLAGKPQPQIPFTELSPDSFFFSLSLSLMRKQPNYTCMLKNLTETVLHLNLGHFVGFFECVCVQFCSTLCIPFDETTIEQHLRHHLQDWKMRQTPKLLRQKLHCIWTWRFFFSIFHFVYYIYIYILLSFTYFLYLFLSLFFLFFIFNHLSVSLMLVQLIVD